MAKWKRLLSRPSRAIIVSSKPRLRGGPKVHCSGRDVALGFPFVSGSLCHSTSEPANESLRAANMRLKLAGLSFSKESEWLCPGGHGLSSTSLAPAGKSPAAEARSVRQRLAHSSDRTPAQCTALESAGESRAMSSCED